MTGTEIGWVRALASAVAVVAVGFVGAVYVPDVLLNSLSGIDSAARSLLAAGVSMAVVLAMAWALRRLQARRVI